MASSIVDRMGDRPCSPTKLDASGRRKADAPRRATCVERSLSVEGRANGRASARNEARGFRGGLCAASMNRQNCLRQGCLPAWLSNLARPWSLSILGNPSKAALTEQARLAPNASGTLQNGVSLPIIRISGRGDLGAAFRSVGRDSICLNTACGRWNSWRTLLASSTRHGTLQVATVAARV